MKQHTRIISIFLSALFGSTLFAVAAPLETTIQGQRRDRIEIERVVPEPDPALKDVVPFSRLGQTDYILSEELGYLDQQKQIALMDVRSPKAYKPSMIEFPKPPYFVQAYPPPPEPVIVDRRPDAPPLPGEQETWTFLVIDQNNNLLRKIEGNTIPVEPIQWDGMVRGNFVLRTDEIYSSILIIQETPEVSRTIVGDPIWMPALKYLDGNQIVFEFSNKRVYNERAASFSPPLMVLVDQLLNELRKYEGAPFRVRIFDRDLNLAQERKEAWKKLLAENLLMDQAKFDVGVSLPGERGEVTRIVLEITK